MHCRRHDETLVATHASRIDNRDLEGVTELFRQAEIRSPAKDAVSAG